MTQLERISTDHRVPVRRDDCLDPVIPGKNGHLYTDAGAVCVCFTDDGRKTPFPGKQFKTYRLATLKPYVVRLKQEGDCEFVAQIEDSKEAIDCALFRVLKAKRFKATKGISRPVPQALLDAARNRRKTG
jgi:hypothetical protein